MQTLIINAHPDFKNDYSFSSKLQQLFLKEFSKRFPEEKPTVLNLYDQPIPRIETDQLLGIWNKQREGLELNSFEKEIYSTSANLLTQFKEHHRIVIVSPLHNFNITSRMKDYLDNILIARETFKYTEDGSVGLMTDDYNVLLLQASGSIYTLNDRYTPLEFSHYYLKEMFQEIMGFNKFDIVRAQGTAVLDSEAILKTAESEMTEAVTNFYTPSKL
ncbi:NAD(P)H-dependent oxidoreductase [Vagococcus sp. PNs007]|uniref:FMN dependent NADH:quinone oxidoreductase n=1 Tax=Vagococcus proximus TaxID=2991417 RepID=A0ABT5X215_9ENTE|nr:NAD(P)H-dependent oxidoreductase [Vagococcus proximus]MDF0479936.1 NAD(P)H-dependent oxidoreductase [Vagococcus proximus]